MDRTITVEPNSSGAVTIRLPETSDCNASGAFCTRDGRALSHSLSATVAGPMGISVADARVEEGVGKTIDFAVALDRAASRTVTVDYATSDGTATAGTDYTATSGTLTFRAGDRSKTVSVAVLDDSHDEGEETLTLRLSNPSSGRMTDGEAIGTIEYADPMPRSFVARFGRTAALQVVEQVQERIEARRETGFRGRFAGRELRRGMERDIALSFLRRLGGVSGTGPTGDGVDPMGGVSGQNVGLDWGRLLRTGLGGDVRTTMFGADYAQGPLTAGLMLSHSRGLGEYAGVDGGVLHSSVTGLFPWLGYRAAGRVSAWAVTGYGEPQGYGFVGDARAHGAGGLGRLHHRRPVAQAERRGRASPRRRRRRDGLGPGPGRRPRRLGLFHRPGRGGTSAYAARARGRRLLGAGRFGSVELEPVSVHAPGLQCARVSVVGRACHRRRRGPRGRRTGWREVVGGGSR